MKQSKDSRGLKSNTPTYWHTEQQNWRGKLLYFSNVVGEKRKKKNPTGFRFKSFNSSLVTLFLHFNRLHIKHDLTLQLKIPSHFWSNRHGAILLLIWTYGLYRTWVMWLRWLPSLGPRSPGILSRGSRCRSSRSSEKPGKRAQMFVLGGQISSCLNMQVSKN